jgi:hypothetical protein
MSEPQNAGLLTPTGRPAQMQFTSHLVTAGTDMIPSGRSARGSRSGIGGSLLCRRQDHYEVIRSIAGRRLRSVRNRPPRLR